MFKLFQLTLGRYATIVSGREIRFLAVFGTSWKRLLVEASLSN